MTCFDRHRDGHVTLFRWFTVTPSGQQEVDCRRSHFPLHCPAAPGYRSVASIFFAEISVVVVVVVVVGTSCGRRRYLPSPPEPANPGAPSQHYQSFSLASSGARGVLRMSLILPSRHRPSREEQTSSQKTRHCHLVDESQDGGPQTVV